MENSELLVWFLLAEKPEWVHPLDVVLLAYLMLRLDDEGKCEPTIPEMGKACGIVNRQSMRESLKRLEENGWITITYRAGSGLPNVYSVQLENLPRWDQQVISESSEQKAN